MIDSAIVGRIPRAGALWFQSAQTNRFYLSKNAACNRGWTKHIVIVRCSPLLSTNGFHGKSTDRLSLPAICKTIGTVECECNLELHPRLSNNRAVTLHFAFWKQRRRSSISTRCCNECNISRELLSNELNNICVCTDANEIIIRYIRTFITYCPSVTTYFCNVTQRDIKMRW